MNPVSFVFNLISVGLGLLCAGTLVEVLVIFEKKAARDTEIGIVSIGEWNRQLYGENPRQPSVAHKRKLQHRARRGPPSLTGIKESNLSALENDRKS